MLRIRQVIGLNSSTVTPIFAAPTAFNSASFSNPFSSAFAGRRPPVTGYSIRFTGGPADKWLGGQKVFLFIQLPLHLHNDFGCLLQLHVFSRPQRFVGRINFNVGRYPCSFKRTSAPTECCIFRPGASEMAQSRRLRVTAKVRPERGQGYVLTRLPADKVSHSHEPTRARLR